MQVRVIRNWRHYRTGRVMEIADGAANLLLKRGIVEPAGGEQEFATVSPPQAAVRRRGRPPKRGR